MVKRLRKEMKRRNDVGTATQRLRRRMVCFPTVVVGIPGETNRRSQAAEKPGLLYVRLSSVDLQTGGGPERRAGKVEIAGKLRGQKTLTETV